MSWGIWYILCTQKQARYSQRKSHHSYGFIILGKLGNCMSYKNMIWDATMWQNNNKEHLIQKTLLLTWSWSVAGLKFGPKKKEESYRADAVAKKQKFRKTSSQCIRYLIIFSRSFKFFFIWWPHFYFAFVCSYIVCYSNRRFEYLQEQICSYFHQPGVLGVDCTVWGMLRGVSFLS